jgi:hypothetical protein
MGPRPREDATGFSASTAELLEKVGMISSGWGLERSNPLSDPPAFSELASRRLSRAVEEPYDLFVVRDLFGIGYSATSSP